MPTGIVKWFNNAKGYGFILPDDGGGDVFAHYSCIEMDGYKTLRAGQSVEFELDHGPKGRQASRVTATQSCRDSMPESALGQPYHDRKLYFG